MTTIAAWHSIIEWVATWFYWTGIGVSLALVPILLLSRKVPQSKFAWILFVVGFPWIGALFYLTLGRPTLHRKVIRLRGRRGASLARMDQALRESGILGPARSPAAPSDQMVLDARMFGAMPPVAGNEFTLLTEGPDAFAAAREAILAARHHVHLVTYIFKDDPTGRGTLTLLAEVAKKGVEVRVLYDGLGTMHTRSSFFGPIREAGGEVSSFLPFSPFVSGLRINLRNHRKLLIVDGQVAFLGGMNIGDEYASGRLWRDVHSRVRGPIVPALQRVFVEDWHFATGRLLDAEAYFPHPAPAGDVPVQVVDSGPDQDDPHAEEMMFSALAAADKSVDILTPYLVPTEPLEQALISSARRGRRVRILLPEFVDHHVVRWATDSYLARLIARGVEVWRHPAMVHGKVVIVDGAWATLGSANLDMRSLRLNFELNVALPHAPTAELLTRYYEGELRASRRLEVADLRASLPLRLLRSAAHMLSPML